MALGRNSRSFLAPDAVHLGIADIVVCAQCHELSYDRRMPHIERAHFILYVADQQRSTSFYTAALAVMPHLDVPGMTEFAIGPSVVLGLMPTAAIGRLLPDLPVATATTATATDEPAARAELYLLVDDPVAAHQRALQAGARELSPVQARDWGHTVGYSLDPDGHVLAFAR